MTWEASDKFENEMISWSNAWHFNLFPYLLFLLLLFLLLFQTLQSASCTWKFTVNQSCYFRISTSNQNEIIISRELRWVRSITTIWNSSDFDCSRERARVNFTRNIQLRVVLAVYQFSNIIRYIKNQLPYHKCYRKISRFPIHFIYFQNLINRFSIYIPKNWPPAKAKA